MIGQNIAHIFTIKQINFKAFVQPRDFDNHTSLVDVGV